MVKRIKVVFSIGGLHGGGSERQMVSLLRNINREKVEPFLYLVYRTGPLLKEVPDDVPVVAFEERYRGSHWPGVSCIAGEYGIWLAFWSKPGQTSVTTERF